MSAIAFSILPDGMILLSDGRSASENTPDVTKSTTHRKVWTVNNIGLFWLGYYPESGVEKGLLRALYDRTTVVGAADRAGKYLELVFGSKMEKFKGPDRLRYVVLLIGYEDGSPVAYQLDSEQEDMFTPQWVPMPTEQEIHGFLAYDSEADTTIYQQQIAKLISQREFQNVQELCISAFIEVLREMKAQGKPVGGKVFCESITPKGQSIFQQAMRN